ncbi:hypothetical protein V6N11_069685 [Hibiscus sabdariffa]|uniref:Uncharacterized protein n=2 Tax=Hibiscus sabdariffa TaxID=183260 RepID=A0ABR2AFU1_9ROSI
MENPNRNPSHNHNNFPLEGLPNPPGAVVSDHGMDGVSTHVVIPPSLEWSGSPILLDDVRQKLKGDGMSLSDGGESDGNDGERELSEEAGLARMKGKTSYASAVLGSSQDGGPHGGASCDEEVSIKDDDFRVLRDGLFPVVQFSNRAQEPLDHNTQKTLIMRLLGRSIGEWPVDSIR